MSERAYDPELAAIVAQLPVETDWSDLPRAREQMAAMIASVEATPSGDEAGVVWDDRIVPGPTDAPELSVRVYTPNSTTVSRPGLVYIHGGGFCFGAVAHEHGGARQACQVADAIVVSVEYRLAPEHPFPAGLEDCYAALVWLSEHADELGVDRERIGVMGQSAGGGLAAGLALLARDRGGPSLCFQLLGIPELDHRLETPSMRQFVDTPLWNRPNAVESWRCYLGENAGDVSPYASPALAKDLAGLPRAFVSTMEFDPLRDEGLEYAMRLLAAGVSTEVHQYPGTFHGSSLVTGAAVSKRAHRDLLDALVRGLAPR